MIQTPPRIQVASKSDLPEDPSHKRVNLSYYTKAQQPFDFRSRILKTAATSSSQLQFKLKAASQITSYTSGPPDTGAPRLPG